jgi:ABC-type lipoprotein release transport system permease subunit
MVFGVRPRDGATIAAAATVLAIALLATAAPSWRAARTDAAQSLHRG